MHNDLTLVVIDIPPQHQKIYNWKPPNSQITQYKMVPSLAGNQAAWVATTTRRPMKWLHFETKLAGAHFMGCRGGGKVSLGPTHA